MGTTAHRVQKGSPTTHKDVGSGAPDLQTVTDALASGKCNTAFTIKVPLVVHDWLHTHHGGALVRRLLRQHLLFISPPTATDEGAANTV